VETVLENSGTEDEAILEDVGPRVPRQPVYKLTRGKDQTYVTELGGDKKWHLIVAVSKSQSSHHREIGEELFVMIKAQGGDPDADLPTAKENYQVLATESGQITEMNALAVGISAWRLGAGRSKQGESVQAGAGIEIHAKPGQMIHAGQPLFTLHTDETERFERAIEALADCVHISNAGEKITQLPLILEKITR
jgi:hypothetical protein